jgi:hypothetical protein
MGFELEPQALENLTGPVTCYEAAQHQQRRPRKKRFKKLR